MDDRHFSKLLKHFNLSWKGYRKVRKGVKKRISRHMQELGCRHVDQYLVVLSNDLEAESACQRCLTVSISRFYRDRQLWDVLREHILPNLIAKASNAENRSSFKVWSCGCARGEEPYSFSILWEEFKQERKACENETGPLPELELWATDINSVYLVMAKAGAYEYRSLRELPSNFAEKYFHKVAGKKLYFVASRLKERITFKEHNIIQEPPPSENFSLVFLRNNLLTYYRSPQKVNTLNRVIASMQPGAVMIVGSHEKLPEVSHFMAPSVHSPWIYNKLP